MNIIESLLNGNISDAKRKARSRSFMWLVQQGDQMGFDAMERWKIAAFLKGMINWEEYTQK
jgi:hypothetical protein